MIILKLEELIEKKAESLGRNITMSEIADEIGVSRNTLSKIVNTNHYRLNTHTLDKLCDYFDCQDIKELLDFIPNRNLETRELTLLDIKMHKRILDQKLASVLENELHQLNISPKEIYREYALEVSGYHKKIYVDMAVKDQKNKTIFILITTKLYWGFDKERFDFLQEHHPNKVIFITCSKEVPRDLMEVEGSEIELEVYHTRIFYNDFEGEIKKVYLKRLK